MSLLQSLCPVLDLKIDLSLLKIVLNDSPYSKPWGFTTKSSLLHFQNQCYNLTPRSCPWPPTAPSPCSWPSDRSDVPENDHKWLPISEILGLDTKTNSPALFGPIPPLTPQNSSLRHRAKALTQFFQWFGVIWGTRDLIPSEEVFIFVS